MRVGEGDRVHGSGSEDIFVGGAVVYVQAFGNCGPGEYFFRYVSVLLMF